MYCIKCGNQVLENSAFCAFCGAKISPLPIQSDNNMAIGTTNNATSTLSEKAETYTMLASSAYGDKNWERVREYSDKVLEIDQRNIEHGCLRELHL